MKKLIVLSLAVFSLSTSTAQAETQYAKCSLQEVTTLGIPLQVHYYAGWVDVRALDRAWKKACSRVAGAYRWVNGDFVRATQVVDRLYPGMGHGAWARECIKSEGGNGRWVPNSQGSGAGGWLQFMESTFNSVIDGAMWRARAHGLKNLPGYVRSWYSPLGQALAGSEMLFQRRRGEWSGSTC